MYRIVKSKKPTAFGIYKVSKIEKGETYIDAFPVISADTLKELLELLVKLNKAIEQETLDKSDVITLHNKLWHETDHPFFEDISEELIEDEFLDEHESLRAENF